MSVLGRCGSSAASKQHPHLIRKAPQECPFKIGTRMPCEWFLARSLYCRNCAHWDLCQEPTKHLQTQTQRRGIWMSVLGECGSSAASKQHPHLPRKAPQECPFKIGTRMPCEWFLARSLYQVTVLQKLCSLGLVPRTYQAPTNPDSKEGNLDVCAGRMWKLSSIQAASTSHTQSSTRMPFQNRKTHAMRVVPCQVTVLQKLCSLGLVPRPYQAPTNPDSKEGNLDVCAGRMQKLSSIQAASTSHTQSSALPSL